MDNSGLVKLSNFGESRAPGVDDTKLDEPAESFVYLPQSVLKGGHYTSASDVYSLGILVWEVWHDKVVFAEERKGKLHTFIDLHDPCQVMMEGVPPHQSATEIGELVKRCMCLEKMQQPDLHNFRDQWESLMEQFQEEETPE